MPAASDLTDRVAFITGGASGIGLGIGGVLADAGMKIAIADVDAGELDRAAEQLRDAGAQAIACVLDVRDRDAWRAAVERATGELGPVHILCNNAGVTSYDPLAEMPPENWDWIVGVNLTGVFNGIRAAVPGMIGAGEGGHVVNTASTAGLHPTPGFAIGAYAATKAAVVSLSESLRIELEPNGIGVSALCPGLVDTRIGVSSAGLRPVEAVRPRPASLAQAKRPGAASPREVGERVLAGIRRNENYILTHPDIRPSVEERYATLLADFREPAHVE
jgi:NAD(P)-dependent dehydrogenase (short-subunit alcohol dehydrogenase family)